MTKRLKISVKHYLNKKVKQQPKEDNFFGDLPEYPLYYYITINRKTIHKTSHLGIYLNDDIFEKGEYISGLGDLKELIKNESDIIIKTCEIFLNDYEQNKVNKNFRLLSKRGFSSKDEFINGLNSYIEFYTQSIFYLVSNYSRKEIKMFLLNKMFNSINTTGLNKELEKTDLIEINLNSIIDKRTFYTNNLDNERLNLYYLERCLYACLATSSLKYGYDLPLIEWINGDLKQTIVEIILEKEKKDFITKYCGDFVFNKYYFEKNFVPIINKVISVDYQIKKLMIE